MRSSTTKFQNIAGDLARLARRREALVSNAFEALEIRHPELAGEIKEYIGSRQRAAHWMCAPQRATGGRIPYDLLAEGDEDGLWDLMEPIQSGAAPTALTRADPLAAATSARALACRGRAMTRTP